MTIEQAETIAGMNSEHVREVLMDHIFDESTLDLAPEEMNAEDHHAWKFEHQSSNRDISRLYVYGRPSKLTIENWKVDDPSGTIFRGAVDGVDRFFDYRIDVVHEKIIKQSNIMQVSRELVAAAVK